jgi:hypothetical protein
VQEIQIRQLYSQHLREVGLWHHHRGESRHYGASRNDHNAASRSSTDFQTVNAIQPTRGGANDLFVARIHLGSKPQIDSASIASKKLIVAGRGFDDGARILLNGEQQKTKNDLITPGTVLIAKKAGKKIPAGSTVTLQVRNTDGTLSAAFSFMRQRLASWATKSEYEA